MEDLAKLEIFRTVKQCMSRMRTFLDEYKVEVDRLDMSGKSGPKGKPYYDQLQLLIGREHHIRPAYTVRSYRSML